MSCTGLHVDVDVAAAQAFVEGRRNGDNATRSHAAISGPLRHPMRNAIAPMTIATTVTRTRVGRAARRIDGGGSRDSATSKQDYQRGKGNQKDPDGTHTRVYDGETLLHILIGSDPSPRAPRREHPPLGLLVFWLLELSQ